MISAGVGSKAILMLHGRGADAEDIIGISSFFNAKSYAFTAKGNAWYPLPFLNPKSSNEPHISNNLSRVHDVVLELKKSHGEVFLLGFSQGACLALEYASKHEVSGVVAFSGGFIGAESDFPREFKTRRVVLCCSKNDPFIPFERAVKSAEICKNFGAVVMTHFYDGSSHTISKDDIELAKSLID
jgi:phospholipase/carboxylesterase